jgi:HEAT repeat protein
MALSRQGTSAASALPELRKLIQDKNAEVRNAAQYALPRIDPTALSHPQK